MVVTVTAYRKGEKMFVIRSMSTSNWNGRDPVTPYHVYLKPFGERGSAWWTSSQIEAQKFETFGEAFAEAVKLGINNRGGSWDIAPYDTRRVPNVWDRAPTPEQIAENQRRLAPKPGSFRFAFPNG